MNEQKIVFDGTKLPLEGAPSKTTTYGMTLLFSPELNQSESRQFAASAT
jgi:hypothetical protein